MAEWEPKPSTSRRRSACRAPPTLAACTRAPIPAVEAEVCREEAARRRTSRLFGTTTTAVATASAVGSPIGRQHERPARRLHAIIADADRDRVHRRSTSPRGATKELALEKTTSRPPGPGRRRPHPHRARRGGAIVTLDDKLGIARAPQRLRRAARPRGRQANSDHVACASGELVTLPAAGASRPACSTSIATSATCRRRRQLYVTRFRSAELLALDRVARSPRASRRRSSRAHRRKVPSGSRLADRRSTPSRRSRGDRSRWPTARSDGPPALSCRRCSTRRGRLRRAGAAAAPSRHALDRRATGARRFAARPVAQVGALPVDIAVSRRATSSRSSSPAPALQVVPSVALVARRDDVRRRRQVVMVRRNRRR